MIVPRRFLGILPETGLERPADMRLQRLRRRLTIAARYCIDDGLMLGQRHLASALRRQRGRRHQRHRPIDKVQLLN